MPRSAYSFVVLALFAIPFASEPPTTILGFNAQSSQVERDLEAKFRVIPQPARMREMMQRLSARPHHVGSPDRKSVV